MRYAIYGPPGTGKSTRLIREMKKHHERGIDSARVGLVSFTRAAANELAERIGVKPGRNIATIHSYAFRMLDLSREQVVDNAKLKHFSKVSRIDITGAKSEDGVEYATEGDFYLSLYGYQRSVLSDDPRTVFLRSERIGSLQNYLYFIECYKAWKEAYGYVDFSDMLEQCAGLPAPELDVLFVDEAQDLSPAQWVLVNAWTEQIETVYVAGDDDQAIYVWSGADAEGIQKWERTFEAERIILDQSYRIPASVHRLSQRLISHTSSRVHKEYLPRQDEGHVVNVNSLSRINWVHGDPTLVLYRNHSIRKDVEEILMARCIPYATQGGLSGPLQSPAAAAIRAWLKACDDFYHMGQCFTTGRDEAIIRRMLQPIHARKRLEEIVSSNRDQWRSLFRLPVEVKRYFHAIQTKYGLNVEPTITLMTIHASKGRECDHVVLVNGMSARTEETMLRDRDSEIRTFYVGVTRAKSRLTIVAHDHMLKELR
ncbi:MAG: superfamily I DNA and RNA helicase [Caudoviricetes sp.]|nr:MAG: superfamily I DNA and RNA helicase [Caudoviricetes sp.]